MSDQLDGLFLSAAQNCSEGVKGLMDAFFGFLSRRTDFYFGATRSEAKKIVFEAFKKHEAEALARHEKEKEDSKAREERERKRRAERNEEDLRSKAADVEGEFYSA